MPKSTPNPPRVRKWFSPEWLTRYDGVCDDDDEANLTAKDHALALALVGELSSVEYDVFAAENAAAVTLIQAAARLPAGDFRDGNSIEASIESGHLRHGLHMPKGADISRSARRVEMMTIGGVFPFRMLSASARSVDVIYDVSVYRAHPLNSRKRQSSSVDLTAIASMSCALSVPIALRAIAWLRSKCRAGLGRVVHAYGPRGLHLDIPTRKVKSTLGLSMPTFSAPEFRKAIPRIVEDLKMVGVGAEFEWLYNGRFTEGLRLRLKNIAAYDSASHVFERDPSRKPAPGRPFKPAPAAPPSPKRKYVRKVPYVPPIKKPVAIPTAEFSFEDDGEGWDY